MKKQIYLSILALSCAAFCNLSSPACSKAAEKKDVVADNITIDGVDVSNKTLEEAKEALEPSINKTLSSHFTLSTKEGSIEATAADLKISSNEDKVLEEAIGYGKSGNILERYKEAQHLSDGTGEDFSLSYAPADYAVREFLEAHSQELGREQVNNTIERKDGSFVFVPGKSGYSVNVKKSVSKIRKYFKKSWDGKDATIELSLNEIQPEGKKEDFEKIKDSLGTYTTQYGGSPSGRKTNIINGASKIHGTVLLPGEQISVAEKLAPIDEEHGYAEGTAYENGKIVPSVGGGVCQISSTLYNAAIAAELEIVERHPHSMTVSYVDPSRDAAIAGNILDLKLKNNQKSPIYIDLATSDSAITATIYGEETRPSNRKVEFETEILSKTEPRTVYIADGSQPIGYRSGSGDAHTGYSARLWKIVSVDGKEQSRDIFNTSYYSVKNNEYRIGTASSSPEASAAVAAAVGSQNIGSINSAISQWNASAVAARAQAAQAAQATEAQATESPDAQAPVAEPLPVEAPADQGAAAPVEDALGGAVAAP